MENHENVTPQVIVCHPYTCTPSATCTKYVQKNNKVNSTRTQYVENSYSATEHFELCTNIFYVDLCTSILRELMCFADKILNNLKPSDLNENGLIAIVPAPANMVA